MITNELLKDLQELIEENLDPSLFPYVKGNSIRIGKFVVRSNKKGHRVYNISEGGGPVAVTFSKTAAVAIAKSDPEDSLLEDIMILDQKIEKYYNDCMFYKYTMNHTKDEVRREITQTRYDIARARTEDARSRLDEIIFSNLA